MNRVARLAQGRVPLALIAAALALAALVIWRGELLFDPENERTFPLTLKQFSFAHGEGRQEDGWITVEGYEQGKASITSEWVLINAGQFPFLRMRLEGLQPGMMLSFVWQGTHDPKKLGRTRIARLSDESELVINLSRHPEWNKTVLRIGFDVEDPLERPLRIALPELTTENRRNQMLALIGQLGHRDHWSMRSVNYLLGARWKEETIFTALLVVWVGLGVIFYLLLSLLRRLPIQAEQIGWMVLAGWLLFDGRWLLGHIRESQGTLATYLGKAPSEAAEASLDAPAYHLARAVKEQIGEGREARLLLVADSATMEYWRLRLQYHLAPLNVFNYHRHPTAEYARLGDYLIVVGNPKGLEYEPDRGTLEWGTPRQSLRVEPLLREGVGVLFQILDDSAPPPETPPATPEEG